MKEGSLYAETSDHHKIGRLHHEYPTPFRCLMDHYSFRMMTEDEFKRERMKNKFNAKRGRIDLVVLNSDYISSNTLRIVSGKRYEDLLVSVKQQKHPALDLAIEVVYHPTLDEKPHLGIMEGRAKSTLQDYKKLVELMKFTYPTGVTFCKQAAMFFFSNTTHKDTLSAMFASFPQDPSVNLFKVLHNAPNRLNGSSSTRSKDAR
jgi:uncharacterized short protein YbdD (DUF466 family)